MFKSSFKWRARRLRDELELSYQQVFEILRSQDTAIRARVTPEKDLYQASLEVVCEELKRRGQKQLLLKRDSA